MSEKILSAAYGSLDHPLILGNREIPCYVLEDGTRVLVMTGMLKALDMSLGGSGMGGGQDRLAKFASTQAIKPFINDGLMEKITNPVLFRVPSGGTAAYGYEATILADICDAVLECRKNEKLNRQQDHIAKQCEILVRGFARVGIIALVDEATGYQYVRARQALHEILEQFIADELRPWVKTFEDDFYIQIFRLNGWLYHEKSIRKRPGVIGRWTNDIIYDRLAPGVRKELHRIAERDERGRPKHKLFQRLTEETGHPKLKEHLAAVTALMRAANNWKDFIRSLNRALPRYPDLPLFPDLGKNP